MTLYVMTISALTEWQVSKETERVDKTCLEATPDHCNSVNFIQLSVIKMLLKPMG